MVMADIATASERLEEPGWRRWVHCALLPLFGTIRGRILIAFLRDERSSRARWRGYAALGVKHAGAWSPGPSMNRRYPSITRARRRRTLRPCRPRSPAVRSPATRACGPSSMPPSTGSASRITRSAYRRRTIAIGPRRTSGANRPTRGRGLERSARKSDRIWHARHLLERARPLRRNRRSADRSARDAAAGDGFANRQRALASVATDLRLNFAGTVLAILLSALVAWLLARRIIGPVATASAVAERIAGGKFDGAIPEGGADELGALLAAMGVMREQDQHDDGSRGRRTPFGANPACGGA